MEQDLTLRRALDAVRAIADPVPPWGEIMRSTCTLMRSFGGGFLALEHGKVVEIQEFDLDPAAVSEYTNHYHTQDILMSNSPRPPGTWLDTQKALTNAQRDSNAYYQDFMLKHRMRQYLSLVVEETPSYCAAINFQRDKAEESDEFLQSPPIVAFKNAIQEALAERRKKLSEWIVTAEEVLVRFDEALCLVDTTGNVVHASPLAIPMLEEHSSLRIRGGQFWHPARAVRQLIDDVLARMATGGSSAKLLLPGQGGKACAFEVVRANGLQKLDRRPLFIVRLRRAGTVDHAGMDAACASFGLTETEGLVLARLAGGRTPAEIADEHGVAMSTVRKQIATIMDKTGCSRQVDLVRLALTGAC